MIYSPKPRSQVRILIHRKWSIIPRERVGYEMIDSQRGAKLAIIMSYPTNASEILVFIKNNQGILLDPSLFRFARTNRRQFNGLYFSGMHGTKALYTMAS